MLPTLADGDLLLLLHGARARPGDLVAVRLPRQAEPTTAVKRLVRAEEEGWWVERDNPAEGVDSWSVGAVPHEDLLAVALARLWPRPRLLRSRRGVTP